VEREVVDNESEEEGFEMLFAGLGCSRRNLITSAPNPDLKTRCVKHESIEKPKKSLRDQFTFWIPRIVLVAPALQEKQKWNKSLQEKQPKTNRTLYLIMNPV
jgi:hypothetical protein